MPFQFQCPKGHLLEALESQAGEQCNCPHCGLLMMIPQPDSDEPAASAGQTWSDFPDVTKKVTETAPVDVTKTADDDLLHIPCPNGHLLDTPRDMLGQEVLCPHCQAQFQLREKDSEEFQRRRQIQYEARERKLGNLWLKFAIVTVVLVFAGLALLIWMALNNKPQ